MKIISQSRPITVLKWLVIACIFALCLLRHYGKRFSDHSEKPQSLRVRPLREFGHQNAANSLLQDKRTTVVPSYAIDILRQIRNEKKAPDGFQGGRIFMNREKRLPVRDEYNHKITYREWDLHPTLKGHNRGPERLITGSDGKAYYTGDHYSTFIKIP